MNKYREMANIIIDIFEDYLSDKEVVIDNEEREDEDGAIIFGTDYYILEDKISHYLERRNIVD